MEIREVSMTGESMCCKKCIFMKRYIHTIGFTEGTKTEAKILGIVFICTQDGYKEVEGHDSCNQWKPQQEKRK